MTISYDILFTLEIMHGYYRDEVCEDFEVIPSADCEMMMRNQQMIFRNQHNKLIAGIKVTDSVPAVAMSSNMLFRFYLKLKNPLLQNFTNLSPAGLNGKILYLSNFSENKVGSQLLLSNHIAPFPDKKPYLPGDLAADQNGNIFEAIDSNDGSHALTSKSFWRKADTIFTSVDPYSKTKNYSPGDLASDASAVYRALKKSDESNPQPLKNTAYWKDLSKDQPVTSNDFIPKASASFSVDITQPSKEISIRYFMLNGSTKNYDIEILPEVTQSYVSPVSSVTVDLSKLSPGKYRLLVNEEEHFIYLDPVAVAEGIFGVIEIFCHPAVTADFSLLDGDGKVKQVLYTALFRNRSTIWKYIARSADVSEVNDSNLKYQFAANPPEFISLQPIPLFEQPTKTFSVKKGTSEINSLKNAGINRLRQIDRSGTLYFCSEIFLNY